MLAHDTTSEITERSDPSDTVGQQQPRFRRRTCMGGKLENFDPAAISLENLRRSVPIRKVARTGKLSKNVLVQASSCVVGTMVDLESILEWRTFIRLDRPRVSGWLITQPMMIDLPCLGRRHTPDILQISPTGDVTVWDCHDPRDKLTEFLEVAEETRSVLALCGWRHETVLEFPTIEWCNLSTLLSSRTVNPDVADRVEDVLSLVSAGLNTVGAILDCDGGDGLTRAAFWHMVWRGDLVVDLGAHIRTDTVVQLAS